jgi:hypothetical protein
MAARNLKAKRIKSSGEKLEQQNEVMHVKVPDVKSKNVRVEVVYDGRTVEYGVGEVNGEVDLKFPILEDEGDFFVRVLDISFDEKKNEEKKTLIAKVT